MGGIKAEDVFTPHKAFAKGKQVVQAPPPPEQKVTTITQGAPEEGVTTMTEEEKRKRLKSTQGVLKTPLGTGKQKTTLGGLSR